MKKILTLFLLFIVLLLSAQNDKIKIYFNHNVDNNASSISDAVYISNLDDTIISYIDRAEQSIDVCVYNNSNTDIVNALNSAYYRGVDIRYITDSETSNSALSGLNSNIEVIKNNSSGIMHNKFIIIDADNTEKAILITGSTNFTYQSFFQDYNNMIIFQSSELAQVYRDEFNEMWGSTGLQADESSAKFGSNKTDNTNHHVYVNGTLVDIYFSPSDGTNNQIISALNTADDDIFFAQYYLTRDDIADVIIQKENTGLKIRGLMEETEGYGTEFDNLRNNGVDVYSYLNEAYILHHKYCIIDAFNASSDPQVITGSHNWSTSAETKNDENTVIVHDYYAAQQYFEEFSARWRYISDVKNLKNNFYNAHIPFV